MKIDKCKQCKDRCCKPNVPYISKSELRWLPQPNMVKVKGNLYKLVPINGHCQYFDNGCTLKKKPLACEIYPFLPTKTGWILRTVCPYWWTLDKEALRRAKITFTKRKKDWVG